MTTRFIKPTPTRERLHELMEYSIVEGALYWRDTIGKRCRDRPAGRLDHKGYVRITVDYKAHVRSRLVWTYFFGDPGPNLVDHINGDRADDRLENLRLASESQNRQNSRMFCTNTSGFKGVTYEKSVGRWKAYIYLHNRRKHLGIFSTKEEAADAYAKAAKELHGDFARIQ